MGFLLSGAVIFVFLDKKCLHKKINTFCGIFKSGQKSYSYGTFRNNVLLNLI